MFQQVYLKPDSPIPPATNLWRKYCKEEARTWEIAYHTRVQAWLTIFPKTFEPVINLGDPC